MTPRMNSEIAWVHRLGADGFYPPVGQPVLALIEIDTVDPDHYPMVRLITLHETGAPDGSIGPRYRWRLEDRDMDLPEDDQEEEFLQQYWTVIMWRPTEQER